MLSRDMTHLGPYELDRVHLGDCIELMKALPDKCVDCVVTDPPYGVNYSGGHFHSGKCSIIRKRERLKGDQENVYKTYFHSVYRLLVDLSGGCYSFFSLDKFEYIFPPAPFDKYQVLIWGKPNAKFAAIMARYKHNSEGIIWVQKPPTKWRGNTKQKSLIMMPREAENTFHPTQKPVNLIKLLITNSSDKGDIILDPFSGSGTTGVAAIETGRRFLGFEIDPRWCNLANKRIEAAKAQQSLDLS